MRQKKSYLRLSIKMERLKLELYGNNAELCLKEVSKVLDKMINFQRYDEYNLDLTDELLANNDVTKMINEFSQIYEEYRTNRVAIENKKIIELDKGRVESTLDANEVTKSITKLLFPIQRERVKRIIVHVKGTTKEEAKKITELVAQEMQHADIYPVFTKSNVPSHTIVEGIFFGDFMPEFEED
ncbi:hypothetical protein J4207_03250 [Candidatus Woesearchaeota archaeon]|nr:hypothetical protein [Candidatus Woesearchaeota archaeon]